MNRENLNTAEALSAFFRVFPESCEPYGNGHINDTFWYRSPQISGIFCKE
ncbi:MAG: hypothetical protein J6B55_09140 [Clostridia bacterium]|nr:hypothetical protein [Clostridia bacterium]